MPEEKQKKLDRLLSLLDAENSLTKKDFMDSFEKVINLVLQIQKQQGEAISRLEETYKNVIQKIGDEHSTSLSELKKGTNELFVGDRLKEMDENTKTNFRQLQNFIHESINKKMKSVDDRMVSVKDGERGPPGPPGLEGKFPPALGNRITALEDKLGKIRDAIRQAARTHVPKSLGMRKIPIIRSIDLSADVDGSTSAFNLPRDTVRVLGVWSTQFPVTFRADVDWTFAGQTLTLVTSQVGTPQSGQTLFALIETLFYA